MNVHRKATFSYSIAVSLRLVALLFALICGLAVPSASAQAQAEKQQAAVAPAAGPEKKNGAPESIREEMELLKSTVDDLRSLVQQQQRALVEMQRRLDENERALNVSSSKGAAETAALAASPKKAAETSALQGQSKAPDKAAVVAGWDREKGHAFLRSADGAFETQVGGYGQLDYRGYQSGDHPPNSFFIRRARIALEGKLERYFDFRIEGDFSDPATPLRDFYLNVHRIDELQFRFGQFRVPISQEEMRSDNLQDFVERSLVNNLVPSRSPGLGVSGQINRGDTSIISTAQFEYQIGAFNGKGLLAPNNNGTPETAIRLRFAPWKNSGGFFSKGFIFGGAFTQGRSVGGSSVRGQTESRSFTFFSPDIINGKYIRANGELTWLLGPAVIRAEYDQTNQRRDDLAPGGGNLPGVVAKGYMAQMTYMLTGEDKPEVGVVAPRNNLFGDGGGKQGYGAWELKFRYSNLQIADGTRKSNRADTFFFGPNWYLNRFVRYVLDLGFERFKDPARSPRPGDRNFFVVLSRVQVAF